MKKANYYYLVLLGLTSITISTGALLASHHSNATSTSANASVTVGSACSLTSSGNNHSATISPGNYTPDIGTTNISAVCNDPGGYALYAVGYTNNEYGITSLNGNDSGQTIVTGTATGSSSSDPSNWAMKLAPVTGTYAPTIENSFGSYHIVPSTYTKVASFGSTTDTTTGSKLTTTYAAYISGNQAADTYTGKVKYTMVHPSSNTPKDGPMACAQNKICYSPNANDVVGTMGRQSASDGETKTLLASNFSRAGYGFAGWSDVYDYETNPEANFYGPNESLTVPAGTTNNGLSLYAIWVKSEGSFQDANKVSSVCSNLTQSNPNVTRTFKSISALTDQRDNETYAIAKLADGNCWMIENLRLESTNSDNSTGTFAQGYGTSSTYGNFSGLANPETINFYGNTSSATAAAEPNSLYYAGIQSGTATINIGQIDYAGNRMPRYNNYNHQASSANRPQNPTTNDTINNTTNAGMYSYGNYYTWAAAMANTGNYNTNTIDADGYTPSEAANTSLCPKGWKLPYGNTSGKGLASGSFSYLGTQFRNASSSTPTGTDLSKMWRSYPNNFLYSGYFLNSSASYRGSYSRHWSSTAFDDMSAVYLSISSSNTNYSMLMNKYIGFSIRCVASGA